MYLLYILVLGGCEQQVKQTAWLNINLFIFTNCLVLVRMAVDLESVSGTLGLSWEYTLDRLLVNYTGSFIYTQRNPASFKKWEETGEPSAHLCMEGKQCTFSVYVCLP